MEVIFSNPFEDSYNILESNYNDITTVAFNKLNIKTNYTIDVSLVDDEIIHQVNRDYRGVDKVTDVISFAFNDDEDPLSQINDDSIERSLGEILICLPQALRQAKEIGNSDMRELCFLYTHGLLHLLGYDHMTKEDEEIMFPLQEEILEETQELWKKAN